MLQTPRIMAQTKQQIQAGLAKADMSPRHRFGQNFMIDQNLVRLIADAGVLSSDDTAIEIGPGTGTLTDELLTRAGRVVAVEIDRDLAALLRERFADEPRFTLIEGDALAGKHSLNPRLLEHLHGSTKLLANLPYNIASPLVIEMLIAGISSLTFTVQKEVADRLRATEGQDAYGPLSVMAQMLSRVQVLRTLPPQAFWPAPKIDSALVRMVREDRLGSEARKFGAFVHQIFSFRRKTMRKALTMAGLPADTLLTAANIGAQHRPEVISPERLFALYQALPPMSNGSATDIL